MVLVLPHFLIGKPVPTFPGSALAMSLANAADYPIWANVLIFVVVVGVRDHIAS
ncbi:hypothetical protein SAMN02927924_00128 [Sphingobium faniae]|nr:hypothetical protein SAMN02927924_00128 [Sphingobium faniae]